MNFLPGNLRFGAGQSVQAARGPAAAYRKGQFIDDRPEEGALWLYMLRSPHAHARIISIDTKAAREMPGVEAIYTGADLVADDIGTLPTLLIFPRPDGSPMTVPPRRLLAHELVRYVGETVAAVVATSRFAAQSAAEAIVVEYQELPSVVDPLAAIKPGAPVVWSEVARQCRCRDELRRCGRGGCDFAKADHVVSLDLVNQRLVPCAMEPRSTIAEVEKKPDGLILHVQSQTPASTRDILAEAVLKRPKESIQVLVGDIGGGFGHKTNLYPEDGIGGLCRHQAEQKGALARRAIGRFSGWHPWPRSDLDGRIRARCQGPCTGLPGALGRRYRCLYLRPGALIPLVLGPFVQTGVYDLPLVHYDLKAVMTHTAPVRRLSRRGPPRSRLRRRAADGCRRPPDRNGPARHSQGQLRQAGANALH